MQQLHEIHDCIQRMRDLTLGTLGFHNRASNNEALQRLTSSCPSLCPLTEGDLASRPGNHDTGSDPDLILATCSTNSSPTHLPSASHAQQLAQGIDRRRSWTGDIEDLESNRRGRRRFSGQNHLLQAQNMVYRLLNSVTNRFNFGEFELSKNIPSCQFSSCCETRVLSSAKIEAHRDCVGLKTSTVTVIYSLLR